MKKLLFLLLLPIFGYSQVDTTITTSIYTSYYSFKYKSPVAVVYVLHNGGGKVSRKGMNFVNEKSKKFSCSNDYSGMGYDKGHMANAEDFANDSLNLRKTFKFYNCVPQTPTLNRGVWKTLETQIRERSQKDSLLIVCYNHYSKFKMNSVTIPDTCYKIVFSIKTRN